jgi:hypothetical protein
VNPINQQQLIIHPIHKKMAEPVRLQQEIGSMASGKGSMSLGGGIAGSRPAADDPNDSIRADTGRSVREDGPVGGPFGSGGDSGNPGSKPGSLIKSTFETMTSNMNDQEPMSGQIVGEGEEDSNKKTLLATFADVSSSGNQLE